MFRIVAGVDGCLGRAAVLIAGEAEQCQVRDIGGAKQGSAHLRAARRHRGSEEQDGHDGVRLSHDTRLRATVTLTLNRRSLPAESVHDELLTHRLFTARCTVP